MDQNGISSVEISEWLFGQALPLWARSGQLANGAFHERIDRLGQPIPGRALRMRTQARQTYVFASAVRQGWSGREMAVQAFQFVRDHYWHADGGWIFSVDEAGTPVDQRRDMYEQAFALLMLATLKQIEIDEDVDQWIDASLAFVDQVLADNAYGGYRQGIPDLLPRGQNPHMHMLEAALALYEVRRQPEDLARAERLVALFSKHLFDRENAMLGEFFENDWRPASGGDGDIVEPGHQFEWVWLLQRYARAADDDAVLTMARALYNKSVRFGIDLEDGLVFDRIMRNGQVSDDGKRLWPQAEALKAHLAMAELGAPLEPARLALQGLFDHYLDLRDGLWREHLYRDRRDQVDFVPATSLYHLFVALSEYLRVVEGS